MPGRSYNAGSEYRYGFNGKELDKEVASTTTYDYGFRIYSPALGKFLSVDPLTKKYTWLTPYQFAGNCPIWAIDIDGLEADKNTDPANQAAHPIQTIEDGYGDYIKRTYSMNLSNSKMTAKQIFEDISTNFARYTTGVSYFERIKGKGKAAIGDEWSITGGPNYHSTPVSTIKKKFPTSSDKLLEVQKNFVDEKSGTYHWGDVQSGVTVKAISQLTDGNFQSYSFTFSTWKGHVEAGEITFSISQIGTGENVYINFSITSNSRSSNFVTDKAYRLFGKSEQTKHWITFFKNLQVVTGSNPATPKQSTEVSENPIKEKEQTVIKQAPSTS